MSKKTVINNKDIKPQNNDNCKDKIMVLDNKKQKGKKKELVEESDDEKTNKDDTQLDLVNNDDNKKLLVESGDVAQKDNKRKKLSKNELYEKDQERFFAEIKDLIEVKKNGSFTSENIQKEGVLDSILIGMKKYYDSELTRGISGKDTKTILALIRKLCNHHKYDVLKKEKKTSDDRSFTYYIVSQEE